MVDGVRPPWADAAADRSDQDEPFVLEHPAAAADVDEATCGRFVQMASNVDEVDIDSTRRLAQPRCSGQLRTGDDPSASTLQGCEQRHLTITEAEPLDAVTLRRPAEWGWRGSGFAHGERR